MKSLAYEGTASRKALELLRRQGVYIYQGTTYLVGAYATIRFDVPPQRKDRFFGSLKKLLSEKIQ